MQYPMFPWFWIVLAMCVTLCAAPKNVACTVAASASSAAAAGVTASGIAVGTTAVAGAAAAAWLMLGRKGRPTQPHLDTAAQPAALRRAKEPSVLVAPKKRAELVRSHAGAVRGAIAAGPSCGQESCELEAEEADADDAFCDENVDADGETSDEESEDEEETMDSGGGNSSAGKLWTARQFPEGTSAAHNWDQDNLLAAQKWECPCTDRVSCISSDRIQLTELGWYRKTFRLQHKGTSGGMRDACRRELEAHYDKKTSSFTRSFVIGPVGDCCAASAGLAKGLSFGTFASARADAIHDRPWHKDRVQRRGRKLGEERAHLLAYIRTLKAGYEGPKGGSDPKAKWKTAYMSVSKRWKEYERHRRARSLPIVGSKALFAKLWSEQTDIVQEEACGHGKCNTCGDLLAQEDTYNGRHDDEAKRQLKRIGEERALHDKEHLGERNCAQPARM